MAIGRKAGLWVTVVLVSGAGCPEFPEYLLHSDRGADGRRDASVDRRADAARDVIVDRHADTARDRSTDLRDLPGADLKTDRTLDVTPDAKADAAVVPGTYMLVPAGTFQMGAPAAEPCSSNNETLHTVTLTQPFFIGSTEVTQIDFLKVMNYLPAKFTTCGGNCPVENVSWHEAAAYCNALSALAALAPCYTCTGIGPAFTCAAAPAYAQAQVYACPGYRLPTEAEWEYAYRAGTVTALYSGAISSNCNSTDPNADLIAYYSDKTTHPVAQKVANAWKLYDMAGNVWEWTNDLHATDLGPTAAQDPWGASTGTARTYRGGSWFYGLKYLRAAYRVGFSATGRSNDLGFRCVRRK
jgi:formylglycine-generating enzyme required for sulfatase activity